MGLFTAKDARQDRIEGDQPGADHYLTKPVCLEELRAVTLIQPRLNDVGALG